MISDSAKYLINLLTSKKKNMPEVAIILGSGLGSVAERIVDPLAIPYSDIPGFPISTAIGHKGNLIFGRYGNRNVVAMQGRFHYYEGYSMEEVTLPIRVFSKLGVKTLLVSNAAGSLDGDLCKMGDLMVIEDHINLMPNPLIGPNNEDFGPRFPDMSHAYSPRLRTLADNMAMQMHVSLKHGVYVGTTGPSYETPAECRMFHLMGATAVGMSTVPEVIVANHCGMEVFGMSVITNVCNKTLDSTVLNDGDDVLQQADRVTDTMATLFEKIIANS